MTQGTLFTKWRSAILSPCRRYRYRLSLDLGDPSKRVLFVMLNPSTADESQDDPTITRCKTFTTFWKFGALDVCNLFAWRSTDMKALATVDDPVGRTDLGCGTNDEHIVACSQAAARIVLAWGNGPPALRGVMTERAQEVLALVTRHAKTLPLAFRMTKAGQPEHPLYQASDAQLIPVHGLDLLRLGLEKEKRDG